MGLCVPEPLRAGESCAKYRQTLRHGVLPWCRCQRFSQPTTQYVRTGRSARQDFKPMQASRNLAP
eukprot:956844-Heterocapsa_arctica.AAC.1